MHAYNFIDPAVFSDSDIVESKLNSMDLTQNELKSVLERGLSGRYSTTQNHPVTARGHYFYGEAVSGVREILAPKGFKKLSRRNVELTVNDTIALYICRGCEQTGMINGYPESRMPKGDFTCELMGLIRNNNPGQGILKLDDAQMALSLNIPDGTEVPLLPNKLGLDLWFLLYNFYKIDEHHRVGIRAELSRPIYYNQKNIVNGFSTRLILNIQRPDPLLGNGEEPQFTPDIEIDILKVS